MNYKKIVNFLFELNESKRSPREGWQRVGVRNPESIAEHTAICAQIAFVLAKMEGADAKQAVVLALFHDIGEIRAGDDDLMAQIYHDKNGAETKARMAQIEELFLKDEFSKIFGELDEKNTKEAIIVKDADLLELAIQAKVYEHSGYRAALLFIDGMRNKLKTESAKKLLLEIEKSKIEDWWMAIPEIAAIAKKISGKEYF